MFAGRYFDPGRAVVTAAPFYRVSVLTRRTLDDPLVVTTERYFRDKLDACDVSARLASALVNRGGGVMRMTLYPDDGGGALLGSWRDDARSPLHVIRIEEGIIDDAVPVLVEDGSIGDA